MNVTEHAYKGPRHHKCVLYVDGSADTLLSLQLQGKYQIKLKCNWQNWCCTSDNT